MSLSDHMVSFIVVICDLCCLLSSVYKSWLHSPVMSHLSPMAQPFIFYFCVAHKIIA